MVNIMCTTHALLPCMLLHKTSLTGCLKQGMHVVCTEYACDLQNRKHDGPQTRAQQLHVCAPACIALACLQL